MRNYVAEIVAYVAVITVVAAIVLLASLWLSSDHDQRIACISAGGVYNGTIGSCLWSKNIEGPSS